MKPEHLNAQRVYRTPSGRLCRWVPGQRGTPVQARASYQFHYVGKSDDTSGFCFTEPNLRLLKAVG